MADTLYQYYSVKDCGCKAFRIQDPSGQVFEALVLCIKCSRMIELGRITWRKENRNG